MIGTVGPRKLIEASNCGGNHKSWDVACAEMVVSEHKGGDAL